jgi:hypothetical protein
MWYARLVQSAEQRHSFEVLRANIHVVHQLSLLVDAVDLLALALLVPRTWAVEGNQGSTILPSLPAAAPHASC